MSIDARLNKLMPALSARERAILVLKSLKDKTPEDPAWRSAMPQEQTAEFNRLIYLMNACNIYLPLYITTVELRTQELKVRFQWMHSLVCLGLQSWSLAQLVPASKRPRAEAAVDKWPMVELPWGPEQNEHAWPTVVEEMEAGRLWVVSLWEELRSIDILLEEVAQEFGGEDPLRPIMRGALEKTRELLTHLQALLSVGEPLELKEPDEETMELARLYFENGLRLMEKV